uniref:(northern house mosquito) hypothetical protein n=1 Tax=Culex pipiens TaxID=7175 RepID=A0A8D8AJZ9_CULPI
MIPPQQCFATKAATKPNLPAQFNGERNAWLVSIRPFATFRRCGLLRASKTQRVHERRREGVIERECALAENHETKKAYSHPYDILVMILSFYHSFATLI